MYIIACFSNLSITLQYKDITFSEKKQPLAGASLKKFVSFEKFCIVLNIGYAIFSIINLCYNNAIFENDFVLRNIEQWHYKTEDKQR